MLLRERVEVAEEAIESALEAVDAMEVVEGERMWNLMGVRVPFFASLRDRGATGGG